MEPIKRMSARLKSVVSRRRPARIVVRDAPSMQTAEFKNHALQALPTELLDHIFSLLEPADLAIVAALSRRISVMAERLLYASVAFRGIDARRRASVFFSTVISRQDKASFVRKLNIWSLHQFWEDLTYNVEKRRFLQMQNKALRCLHNLEILQVGLYPYSPYLERSKWEKYTINITRSRKRMRELLILPTIQEFDKLTTLTLHVKSPQYPLNADHYDRAELRSTTARDLLPNLRHLDINNMLWLRVFAASNLESLALYFPMGNEWPDVIPRHAHLLSACARSLRTLNIDTGTVGDIAILLAQLTKGGPARLEHLDVSWSLFQHQDEVDAIAASFRLLPHLHTCMMITYAAFSTAVDGYLHPPQLQLLRNVRSKAHGYFDTYPSLQCVGVLWSDWCIFGRSNGGAITTAWKPVKYDYMGQPRPRRSRAWSFA